MLATLALAACGDSGNNIDPTPERINGQPSNEFEPEDIEAAENASQEAQDHCSGTVSEAQEVGCLGHLGEGDIP